MEGGVNNQREERAEERVCLSMRRETERERRGMRTVRERECVKHLISLLCLCDCGVDNQHISAAADMQTCRKGATHFQFSLFHTLLSSVGKSYKGTCLDSPLLSSAPALHSDTV